MLLWGAPARRRAAAESDVLDRQLWAIGADNDQWFEVPADEQRHVLTSIIKRGDLASYRLVEHMLDGGPTGVAFRASSPTCTRGRARPWSPR